MSVRRTVNTAVIALFLGLTLSVVLLQSVAGWQSVPATVQEDIQPQADVAAQDVCGDSLCTGTENCVGCAIDCGVCEQTYCCNGDSFQCDGPFGVIDRGNPCDVEGYTGALYIFSNGDAEERTAAFQSCEQTCEALPGAEILCGNGQTDGGEECDDGNAHDGDGCSSLCVSEIGNCGDGVVNEFLGEQCEPSLHDPGLPYACGADCHVVSPTCGDGTVDSGEQCDDGQGNGDAPNVLCRLNCALARCGDGILDDQAEQCDDGNRGNGDGCDSQCRAE